MQYFRVHPTYLRGWQMLCCELPLDEPLLKEVEEPLVLTIANHTPGHLPEDQPKGPDVHPFVGVEAVCLDGLIQDLWSHVALGAHTGIVPHIQLVGALGVHHCKAWNTEHSHC